MTEATFDKAVSKPFRPSFFLLITLIMAFFIFSGFGMTYFQPMASGSLTPLPPVVHIHGLFFCSWIILLVVQALLVNIRNVALHRSLGTFGIGIGTGVIILGTLITILSLGASNPAPDADFSLIYLSVVAVITFPTLFILAIKNVRKLEIHKRLILFATIVILPPGINRLYMMTLDLQAAPLLATWLTMDALIAAIAIHDWRTLGKVSKTTMVGAAVIILPEILYLPIVGTDAFYTLITFLGNLSYYR